MTLKNRGMGHPSFAAPQPGPPALEVYAEILRRKLLRMTGNVRRSSGGSDAADQIALLVRVFGTDGKGVQHAAAEGKS